MIRRFLLAALLGLWAFPALAAGWLPLAQYPQCSQANTFLARTSGLSAKETAAYQVLICSMVADSTWTTLDFLYWYATNNTTTANLNLVSTNFTGTVHGSPTFTADVGYTGDATAAYIDSGFNPSTATTPNFVQNSAELFGYVLNSRTGSQNYCEIGASTTTFTAFSFIQPFYTGATNYEMNGDTFPSYVTAQAQGLWLTSRTSSSTVTAYHNGIQMATSGSDTSVAVPNEDIVVMAENTNPVSCFTADQTLAVGGGSGLTAAQVTKISNDINAAARVMGINKF